MLIQALISLISLTTTLNEVSDFAGRMEIILTVLLSTVAFKFTIAEALPNINYETKLDWYLLLNFFMIVLVVVQVVVPPLQRAAPAALGPRGPSLLPLPCRQSAASKFLYDDGGSSTTTESKEADAERFDRMFAFCGLIPYFGLIHVWWAWEMLCFYGVFGCLSPRCARVAPSRRAVAVGEEEDGEGCAGMRTSCCRAGGSAARRSASTGASRTSTSRSSSSTPSTSPAGCTFPTRSARPSATPAPSRTDRKSTRLNSSHPSRSRMPSSA